MLEYLRLRNVGPAPEMELSLAPRLNLITGDNGLGKSFLLDVAWWALTRRWPAEVNAKVTSGAMAQPSGPGPATIEFSFQAKKNKAQYPSTFDRKRQSWTGPKGRPGNPGLVIYAQVDGGFSVWDPARNYWVTRGGVEIPERQPAYVFTAREVWDGLRINNLQLCNGLISDWGFWQSEGKATFAMLEAALATLSPSPAERLVPGPLTKLDLEDDRRVPTIHMPYGADVPLPFASAGIRRIAALCYLLVWAWRSHLEASKLLDQAPSHQVTFLVDEIESHLHPRWQRTVVGALLQVMERLAEQATVQILCATHSPLVMASVEPFFDAQQDKWFDLDLTSEQGAPPTVRLEQRTFVRRGDASNWLTSEAFNMSSGGRSVPAEQAVDRALAYLREQAPTLPEATTIDAALRAARLPEMDPFWIRWRAFFAALGGET